MKQQQQTRVNKINIFQTQCSKIKGKPVKEQNNFTPNTQNNNQRPLSRTKIPMNKNQEQQKSQKQINNEPQTRKQQNKMEGKNKVIKILDNSTECQSEKIISDNKIKQNLDQCSLCQKTVNLKQNPLIELSGCNMGHKIHQECLINSLKEQISKKNPHLRCPSCENQITQSQFNQSSSLMIVYERYIQNQIDQICVKNQKQLISCPTNLCEYKFFYFQTQLPTHNCPKCMRMYCLFCQVQINNICDHQCQIQKFKFCNCGQKIIFNSKQEKCRKCGKTNNY